VVKRGVRADEQHLRALNVTGPWFGCVPLINARDVTLLELGTDNFSARMQDGFGKAATEDSCGSSQL
jgi:hypothetical protein